jgi:hypothetical protein
MTVFNEVASPVRRETDEGYDHQKIFREFLTHLGRATRTRNENPAAALDRRK